VSDPCPADTQSDETPGVVEDTGNLIYLQHFLANLAQKYGNNKTGARLAGLKIKSSRSALKKATASDDLPKLRDSFAGLVLVGEW
jgi:hypothetical protein